MIETSDECTTTVRKISGATVAVALGLAVAGPSMRDPGVPAKASLGLTRGIVTDQAVDLPLDPTRPDAPRPTSPIAVVRIAVAGATVRLDDLAARIAPVEGVAEAARADLLWNPTTGDLFERDQLVAQRMRKADLPAAADRVALMRRVRDLAQRAPLQMRLSPEERSLHGGASIDVTVPVPASAGATGRAVIVVAVAGDGTTTLLFPSRSEKLVTVGDVQIALAVGEPFGIDQIIALAADRGSEDLLVSLRRLDRRRAAGELLGLIDALDPAGLRIGTQSIETRP